MKTLLLTACIQPSGSTPGKTLDQLFLDTRSQQYIDAVLYYIQSSNFSHIVLCDNSNYQFSGKLRDNVRNCAAAHGKVLELLSFDGNKKSYLYGYGYGEAEIFDYAFEYSVLLRQCDSWYKITGRYIVSDIDFIVDKTKEYDCFFQKQGLFMSPFTVSTAFFKISNDLYQTFLYQKQIKLFEQLDLQPYKNDYYLYDHFPLERVWYCLLYRYLLTKYSNVSNVSIIYDFPQITAHGMPLWVRSFIYKLYVYRGLSQFGLIHSLVHQLLFYRSYCRGLRDSLF